MQWLAKYVGRGMQRPCLKTNKAAMLSGSCNGAYAVERADDNPGSSDFSGSGREPMTSA